MRRDHESVHSHPDHPHEARARSNRSPGCAARAGSTLAVVLDTIIDLERQVIGATLQAEQELPSGSSFGGLRGGFAQITSSACACTACRS